MTAQEALSKRQTDIAESQPETGLAEWASKIKAMQRQVDADEEAEHIRLEQEIAASRRARVRRSQGLGYANHSTSSLVSSVKDEGESSGLSDNHGDTSKALQTLSGASPAAIPARASGEPPRASPKNETKSPPISLAAFIGGRATGPRLNKPAPQLDPHDLSQIEQPATIQAPHPLFGSGGMALPGLAVRRDEPAKPSSIAALNSANSITRSSESSSATQRYVETYQRTPTFPHDPEVRERTKSTPSYVASSPRSVIKQEASTPPIRATSIPSPYVTLNTTTEEQALRPRSTSPADREVEGVRTPSKSPILVPSLAGPIRPQPRPSPTGPLTLPSGAPSKAFLRTPTQKEPTPSLSRLQGRGFVQNMVNLSTQLESPPLSVTVTPEKNKLSSGRRSSVLDRWQPNVSPSTPSPTSPSSRPVRRSVTVDSTVEKPQIYLKENLTEGPTSNLSVARGNIPSDPIPLSKLNDLKKPSGLGSNTTLVVFKPEPVEVHPIDEFGAKPSRVSNLPAVSKPLSHPTKERARKPRKQLTVLSNSRPEASDKVDSGEDDASPPLMDASSDVLPLPSTLNDLQLASPKPLLEQIPVPETPTIPDQVGRPLHGLIVTNDDADSNYRPAAPSSKELQPVSIRHALPGLAQAGEKRPSQNLSTQRSENVNHGVVRRALPGMTAPAHQSSSAGEPAQLHDSQLTHVPLPSAKRNRIPSTGSRPTVMDVAQTLGQHKGPNDVGDSATTSDFSQHPTVVQAGSRGPAGLNERRKSSYEKYSSIILPPLKEETTPTSTPISTFSRKNGDIESRILQRQVGDASQSVSGDPSFPETTMIGGSRSFLENIDIDNLLNYNTRPRLDFGITTVSIEVLVITGTTATPLSKDTTVFYDTEILVIIHRFRSHKSGLASTDIWGWEGQRAKLGEREQRKLDELAKRYGTAVNIVHQHSETPYLVHTLGGVLAIRQGMRRHWTSENTAMHLVRSLNGMVLIDEKDLNIKNLCSAYSYCVSILDSVYVWYGRGSTPLERAAALEYGQSLAINSSLIEITEGTSDDDEIFWMILGEDDYADAYYWRWRRTSPITDPRAWRVKVELGKSSVTPVESFSIRSYEHGSVYVVDSIWELYVLVAIDARAQRQDIDLALHLALEISSRVSPIRPHIPTVHVLVLPSQLPKDLKLMFRDIDEFSMNKGEIPDHMNILSSAEAHKHLSTSTWNDLALRDLTMLPLGISAPLLDSQQQFI